MESSAREKRGAERRAHARARLKTSINFGSESNFYTGFTQDISEGGIFVATHNVIPRGSIIELEFSIPDGGDPIKVSGEVRWSIEYNEMSDGSPGLGLKFVDMSASDRTRIEKFVKVRDTMFYDEE